jgi:glycoprotein 3-alpha-L-fucosyltransferase
MCRWKYDGPSDSFKALIDMAAVHSSCRLCIHIATKIHEKEVYHLFVRERGQFKSESFYLRYGSVTVVLTLNIFEI